MTTKPTTTKTNPLSLGQIACKEVLLKFRTLKDEEKSIASRLMSMLYAGKTMIVIFRLIRYQISYIVAAEFENVDELMKTMIIPETKFLELVNGESANKLRFRVGELLKVYNVKNNVLPGVQHDAAYWFEREDYPFSVHYAQDAPIQSFNCNTHYICKEVRRALLNAEVSDDSC